MREIARLSDIVLCTCNGSPGTIINPLQFQVYVQALPVALLGSTTTNCEEIHMVITGCPTVLIQARPVVGTADLATCGIVCSYATTFIP